MYKDIINDLIYVKPVSKDERTDLQFNENIKKIQKQYPIATPIYEIEFKKPLTPIRKYYSELLKSFITKKLNEIITNSKSDKLEEEYQYLYKSNENEIKQYFHFIREHISNNQLSEDLFKTSSKDKKSDEAYVIHFMKYNCIMLYMELQDRFKGKAEFEEMDLEEIQETYLYEESPKEIVIKPYDGITIQYTEKVKQDAKAFRPIKGDLAHRIFNEKIIAFDELIAKKDQFSILESKLNENNIIDENYNFIPNKGNKQLLAAFILQIKNKGYFNEFVFPGRKPIKDSKITDFFAHRYSNNSDADKEYRNFKGKQALKFKQLVDNTYWLYQIT
jgi:hypothetical protein